MIENSFQKYCKDFILKSGEELEWEQRDNHNSLLEIRIIKRTERTYRILGLLILSAQTPKTIEMTNDHKLENLKFTPRKKVTLDDNDRQTYKCMEEGWILKEVRFEKDEKTVRSSHYRMGYRLYQHEQFKLQQKVDQTCHDFFQIKNKILTTLPPEDDNYDNLLYQKKLGVQNIRKVVNQLNQNELSSTTFFPLKWHIEKRLKYLHFVHAFSQLCLEKKEFDWKEIGATYYKKIGGSKVFDPYKQEFIEQLEEWTNVLAVELGLTSLGQITPVFFAGQLYGRYGTYDWGPVHAITNISIANEEYQTKATTLWLVENRAILKKKVEQIINVLVKNNWISKQTRKIKLRDVGKRMMDALIRLANDSLAYYMNDDIGRSLFQPAYHDHRPKWFGQVNNHVLHGSGTLFFQSRCGRIKISQSVT